MGYRETGGSLRQGPTQIPGPALLVQPCLCTEVEGWPTLPLPAGLLGWAGLALPPWLCGQWGESTDTVLGSQGWLFPSSSPLTA